MPAEPVTPQQYALQCLPIAYKLADRRMRHECDFEDLVQTGILALMEAVEKQAKTRKKIHNPFGFAKQVMYLAMRDYYYSAPERLEENLVQPVPITFSGEEEYLESVFLRSYFEEVGKVLGPEARIIAENMYEPGPAVVQIALLEMQDKAAKQAAGQAVRGGKTLRIKQEHIRQVVGLPQAAFSALLKSIREFTRAYCAPQSALLPL